MGILLLRFGLAFVFLYAAVSGFINPGVWVGWLPEFVRTNFVLSLFGAMEITVAVWLVSGRQTFWAGLVSGLMLLGIIIFNPQAMIVVFRDIGLALAAFALAILSNEKSPPKRA